MEDTANQKLHKGLVAQDAIDAEIAEPKVKVKEAEDIGEHQYGSVFIHNEGNQLATSSTSTHGAGGLHG